MKKLYRINPSNSQVNGDPGREYDWSLFDWKAETFEVNIIGDYYYGTPAGITSERRAPLPWVDGHSETGEYLHVPYEWDTEGKIYRVYPNDAMLPGVHYRSMKRGIITHTRAVQQGDVWYWELEFAE